MVDFKTLLSKPADQVKKPVPLPPGLYLGTITNFKLDESRQKKTPYVRFEIQLQGPGDGHPDHSVFSEVDFTKKKMNKDYYLTEEAEYRLVDAAKSLGLPVEGRSLGEIIQDMRGLAVLVMVANRPGKDQAGNDTGEFFNDVAELRGQ